MPEGELGVTGKRLTSGASTGGCGQGRALCRRPGRGAGVLENEARGAVGRGPRNPVWGTRRGGPFFRRRAQLAVRLKREFPSSALVRKCWFPEDSSGRRCLGRGLTVLPGVGTGEKRKRLALGLVEQLVKLHALSPECVLVRGKRVALRANFFLSQFEAELGSDAFALIRTVARLICSVLCLYFRYLAF